MDAADLPVGEAAARLRDGTLTARALVEAHLARIAGRDPALGAFVHLAREAARAAADAAADAGLVPGPLHGIPFAVKDLIAVAGMPATCGSRARPPVPEAADADVVAALRAAGAIPLGMLACDEFGLVGPATDAAYPPPANPRDPERVTGGTSSGCAAAVAGGLVRVALGTDSGGSLRIPAAFCGVVALKPARGRLPLGGVFPLAPGLDCVGPMAATVAETALAFDAMAGGTDAITATTGGVAGLRLGYARGWVAGDPATEPGVLAALDAAVDRLRALGAAVAEVSLPPYPVFAACAATLLHAGAAETHRGLPWESYGRLARERIEIGLTLDPEEVRVAWTTAAALGAALERTLFARADALLTATVLGIAPQRRRFDGTEPLWAPERCAAFNLTGHAALSVPAGLSEGMPVGLQIVARDEATALRVGAALEATGHTDR